ncbi:hypothetical protein HDV02_005674 [Globomyces sp. JEL0801]|nr:hypothetical protein HDV02_005674 [Globomyces sp. JEL0801]
MLNDRDLHGNGINYPLIARVDQMPKLEYMNLSGNTFVGEFSQKFTGFCEIKGSDVCDPAESNPTCGLQSCFKVEFLPKYQKIGNEYKSLLDGFRKVNAALRVFVDDQIYPNNIPPADYAKILLDLLVAYVNLDTAGNINEASRSLDILTIGNIALNLGHLLQDFSDVSGIGVPGGPNGGVLGNGDVSNGGDPQGGSGGFPDGQSDFGLGGGSDFIFINNTLPQNSVTVPVTNGQPKPVNQVPNTNLGSNSNSQNNVNIGSNSNTNNNVNIGSNSNSINNPIIGPNSNTNTGSNSDTDKNSNGVALNIDKNDASKMAGSAVIAGGLGLAMLL